MPTTGALPRLITRLVTMLAIAAGLITFAAGTAAAHTALAGSDPAEAAAISQAPIAVTLTFNQEVSVINPVIVVTGPDNTQYQTGSATVDRKIVAVGLNPLGAAGTYSVAYRVVSADGHPVEGQYTFQYAPQPSQPAEQAPEPGAAVTSTENSAAGSSATAPSSSTAAASTTASSNTANPKNAAAAQPAGTSTWVYVALAATAALAVAAIAVYVTQQRRQANRG